MPVGHAVTARIRGFPAFSFSGAPKRSVSNRSTIVMSVSASGAERSAAAKCSSIRSVIRRERISRCSVPSSGAAMRKNRSVGRLSIAPQSMGVWVRHSARRGSFTHAHRACGTAIPASTAVLTCRSRSNTASRYAAASAMLPSAV